MARQNHSGIMPPIQVLLCAFLLVLCGPAKVCAAPAQAGRVAYELSYAGANDPRVSIRITPKSHFLLPPLS